METQGRLKNLARIYISLPFVILFFFKNLLFNRLQSHFLFLWKHNALPRICQRNKFPIKSKLHTCFTSRNINLNNSNLVKKYGLFFKIHGIYFFIYGIFFKTNRTFLKTDRSIEDTRPVELL